MKKYELSDIIHPERPYLRRIRAVRDIGFYIKMGELGGWVESEHNLAQEGQCWILREAMVYGNARVMHKATVAGRAQVYGNAIVSDWGWVGEQSQICGNATIDGTAEVRGDSIVEGGRYSDIVLYGGWHLG